MKKDVTITKQVRIELSREDIMIFVNKLTAGNISDEAVIRFYVKDGRYWDICDEYPVVIFYSEKVAEG